jgi:hypothetical protein
MSPWATQTMKTPPVIVPQTVNPPRENSTVDRNAAVNAGSRKSTATPGAAESFSAARLMPESAARAPPMANAMMVTRRVFTPASRAATALLPVALRFRPYGV